MRNHLLTAAAGLLVAIAAQTAIAIAETWSFGPSLRALVLVFGAATFPVVTVVTLGLPIGCAYFAASRLLRIDSLPRLLLLVGPFVVLQAIGLAQGLNGFALLYASAYVLPAVAGVAMHRPRPPASV